MCPLLIHIVGIDLAANMIGRSNARRGARRIFAVLQNRRLNQHLAYTILDEVRSFLAWRLAIAQQHVAMSVNCGVIPGGICMTINLMSSTAASHYTLLHDV